MNLKGILNFIDSKISIGFDVKPLEAINYFKNKGLKTTFSYADMQAADHVNNFTIAKMMDMDLLQDMYDSLQQAQKKGWTLQQWKDRMIPHLQANGWWGRQAVIDPITGKTIIAELGSSRRLDVIFRTNIQQAYMAGQWQQIKEQERIAPYLMYNAVDDYRTRDEHRALDNKVYPVSHPFWITHYPPNGFNCFLPDTKINGDLVGGIKRFYHGEAIEITTASGRSLRVTANHPILTNRGWIVAKMINPTDKLIAYDRPVEPIHADSCSRQVNNQKLIPTAENLFYSLLCDAFAITESPAFKFDSDFLPINGEVYIDVTDGGLLIKSKSCQSASIKKTLFIPRNSSSNFTAQHISVCSSNADFVVADIVDTQDSINIALRVSELFGNGSFADVASGVHIKNDPLKIIISFSGGLPSSTALSFDGIGVLFDGLPLDEFGLGTATQDNTLFDELSRNATSTDFGLFRYLLETHSAIVFSDPVINVRQFNFSGHVYDFQSKESILSANGIITHNCRCSVIQLSKSDLEDLGYEVSPDAKEEYRDWKNPRTGLVEKIPKGVDPGFNFNAGQARYEQLQKLAKEKAQAIKDKALREAAEEALVLVEMQAKALSSSGIMSAPKNSASKMNNKDTFSQPPTETFSIYDAGALPIKPDTSTPLKKAVITLENEIRKDKLETGAVFDKDGLLLSKKQGLPDRVSFNDDELKLLKNNVFTHNHPNGTTFSLADIERAIENNLLELRVVTSSFRFSLSAPNGWPAIIALGGQIDSAKRRANHIVNDKVRMGEIKPQFAEAEYLHYILVLIAVEFNLIYTREKS